MNIIFWNIRVMGNNDFRVAFRDLYHSNKLSFVFIVEPMVAHNSIVGGFF